MYNYQKIGLFLFCTIPALFAFSQTSTSSPYSRFGLGDLQSNVMSEYVGLGGGSSWSYDAEILNPYNPASYSAFHPKSFLFSTGLSHQTTQMETSDLSQITNNTSFSHLIMGFPISKKAGASIGLIPYSNVGYMFSSRNPELSYPADFVYSGDGSISKIYFGGAYELIEGLSAGFNASYLFGGINRTKKVDFDDATAYSVRSNSRINLKGYYYEFGLIYNKGIAGKEFALGITANNNQNSIDAKQSILTETYEYSGEFEVIKDTSENTTQSGELFLPQFLSIGASISKNQKWLLVADYSLQNWSEYTLFNTSDSLENSIRFSTGVQFTPDAKSITSMLKRIRYRLGFSYVNTPLQFENVQLKQTSISLGFGIPVRKNKTTYNIFIELGERGTTDNNLIKERFARFGVSFNFNGIWFVKQKYD